MKLADIKVYRMIHAENIPHILSNGITHKNSPNRNPDFVVIGDASLIDTRSRRQVSVNNGDYLNLNAPLITLGDFIPFYFGVKMPMLYVVQNGGNFVEKATSPKDIIYVACSIDRILASEGNCYFSDGHATDHLTSFYDRTKINGLPAIIDWAAVKAAYWGRTGQSESQKKKAGGIFSVA